MKAISAETSQTNVIELNKGENEGSARRGSEIEACEDRCDSDSERPMSVSCETLNERQAQSFGHDAVSLAA